MRGKTDTKTNLNVTPQIGTVSVAHIQGFENNLEHYRKSAINDAKNKHHRPLVMARLNQGDAGALAAAEGGAAPSLGQRLAGYADREGMQLVELAVFERAGVGW